MSTTEANASLNDAVRLFREKFGGEPSVAAFAPGRVNLIGEHTDYCNGFVFPMALQKVTVVVGRRVEGEKCRIVSSADGITGDRLFEFTRPSPSNPLTPDESRPWYSYFLGVVAGFDENQGNIPAFEAAIATCVPLGGGLSSSAALEVATYTFLEGLCPDLPRRSGAEKALVCQKAEHRFAGVPCGIMDQFIATLGQADHALLIDCRPEPTSRLVKLSDPNVVIVVINSNVKHALGSSEYPKRFQSCKDAASILGKDSLRDVTMEELLANKDKLSDVQFRRARHVIGEIQRTLDAVAALEANDLTKFGELMNGSHDSLRDDYNVTCKELDELVDLARKVPGVYGSRMTGGGFGGCTVTLVKRDAVDALFQAIKDGYPKGDCFATTAGSGAGLLAL